jgi:pimeloyl-ACP methyl ester carboxylesterase
VELEWLSTGNGEPVTVFAHGLGNGIADTRPLGRGVVGRKVFFQFRGHGRSAVPRGRWTYPDLARDLRAVADLTGATRALGVGLGAAALCRLVADNPGRFARLVFFQPSVFDQPRLQPAGARLAGLLEALEAGDTAAVADIVGAETPPQVRNTPAGWAYVRQRIEQLMRDGLAGGLADLPEQAPVSHRSALSAVTVPALVIGCRGDEHHPAEVAEALAAALPAATLHVYDRPGALWTERTDLRSRIGDFLNV